MPTTTRNYLNRLLLLLATAFLNSGLLNAQSPAIQYKLYRNAFVDSIFFPAANPANPKKIRVRDLNPYNHLDDLRQFGMTDENNAVYLRKSKPGGKFSAGMPVVDSCQIDSIMSHTHVDSDGKRFTCLGFVFIGWTGGRQIVNYTSFVVLDQKGNITHQVMHVKGAAIAPCVDEGGRFLTYAYSIPTACKSGENTGGDRIYDLHTGNIVYDVRTNNDWTNIYLADGYIALMTLPEEKAKRYRVFDLKAKLFYDIRLPYDQVNRIRKVTRDGFLMKSDKETPEVVPYRRFAKPAPMLKEK